MFILVRHGSRHIHHSVRLTDERFFQVHNAVRFSLLLRGTEADSYWLPWKSLGHWHTFSTILIFQPDGQHGLVCFSRLERT